MSHSLLVVGSEPYLWAPLAYRISLALQREGWGVTHLYSSEEVARRAPKDAGCSEVVALDRPASRALGISLVTSLALRKELIRVARAHPPSLTMAVHPAALPVIATVAGPGKRIYLSCELYDSPRPRGLLKRLTEKACRGALPSTNTDPA